VVVEGGGGVDAVAWCELSVVFVAAFKDIVDERLYHVSVLVINLLSLTHVMTIVASLLSFFDMW
jgi:hypothetical protein